MLVVRKFFGLREEALCFSRLIYLTQQNNRGFVALGGGIWENATFPGLQSSGFTPGGASLPGVFYTLNCTYIKARGATACSKLTKAGE